ncbi:toxin glutamine deamidase domain-containing protein [Olleya sp. R77988]|uniref:toxin glutamine deamidase domain-containing protein n=1 Tax=Olleya sp. R77988 TaxID=3093875 RepID=UPI0037C52070
MIKISYEEGTFLTVLEKEYGKKFIKDITPDLIRKTLKPGQRGIVYGQKKGSNLGHVFNVINENGIIKFLDGQKVVKKTADTQKADLIYDYYEFLPTNF